MRKMLASAAMLALLFTGAMTAMPAQGAPSAVRPFDFTSQALCDMQAPKECLSADGTSGHLVRLAGVAENNATRVTVTGNFVCLNGTSDKVQAGGCPFASGSGLNSQFAGSEIVTVNNSHSGLCYNGQDIGGNTVDAIQGTCTATGHLWVLSAPNANGGFNYVNVYVSDQEVQFNAQPDGFSGFDQAGFCDNTIGAPAAVADIRGFQTSTCNVWARQ